MKRRQLLIDCGLSLLAVSLLAGCTSWNLFSGKPKADSDIDAPEVEPRVVGDLAVPFGMFPVKVENVGLVTHLRGTGSDPEPSPQRGMIMEEIKRRNVKNPNQLLASRDVSLVLVRGVLRPGIQKGDRFDVEIRVPNRSETTSLRGGILLETRLSDMAILDNRLLDGKVRGNAQGPVLVDPSATEKSDKALLGTGLVLGGGIAHESRSLGLFLKGVEETNMTPEQIRDAAVKSSQVANAVNRRFHAFKFGSKVGVATAIRGNYVELVIFPRYKDNLDRYMQVIRAIVLHETPGETNDRIVELEKTLLDPTQAAKAAIDLEAIGQPGIDTLLKGIASPDQEVRFYSAEALAYQNRREAAKPLADAARNVPAFRALALTALSVMEDFSAADELRDLLAVPSAETRYGAFRALWMMNANDGLVKGESLGGQFSYHVLDTKGPPMIHVTRNRRAEVVLFGQDQKLLVPVSVNAGNQIMVTGKEDGKITVSKFSTTEADQKRTVSSRVDDVIRAIVELGGTYPDVVQAIQEAKAAGALEGRFAVEALPEGGRTYTRQAPDDDAKTDAKSDDSSGAPDKKTAATVN